MGTEDMGQPSDRLGIEMRGLSSPPRRGALAAAIEELGLRIVTGQYAEGETLPIESDLGSTLGVGRNTLREAVKVLAAKGLLRTARRYGTRVCGKEDWNLLDSDILRWLSTDPKFSLRMRADVTEIRRNIEPFAAELAAARASANEVETLLRAADDLANEDVAVAIEADLRFHGVLYEATKNLALGQFGSLMVAMLRPYFMVSAMQLDNYKPNPVQHRRIAHAILARDAERARQETIILLDVNKIEIDAYIADS